MGNVEGFVFACNYPDCPNGSLKRGLCAEHYREEQRKANREKPSWRKSKTWKYVKLQVLIRDDYLCQLKLPGCLVQATTADHKIAVDDGGEIFDLDNLQATCVPCNSAKELLDRQTRDYAERDRRRYGRLG